LWVNVFLEPVNNLELPRKGDLLSGEDGILCAQEGPSPGLKEGEYSGSSNFFCGPQSNETLTDLLPRQKFHPYPRPPTKTAKREPSYYPFAGK